MNNLILFDKETQENFLKCLTSICENLKAGDKDPITLALDTISLKKNKFNHSYHHDPEFKIAVDEIIDNCYGDDNSSCVNCSG